MTCKEGNRYLINQIIDLLFQLTDHQLSFPMPLFNGSTLGQHFRHILDFYQCILKSDHTDYLDYADRDRNPDVENSVQIALAYFTMVIDGLAALDEKQMVDILTDYNQSDHLNRIKVKSSIGRELMYAYDHAVHHLAMIKIGLQQAFPQVKFPSELGIAPSTIRHRSS